MKFYSYFVSVVALLLMAWLLPTGCQKDNIPAANTSLSYPAGEMVLGGGAYTSARPSVAAVGTCSFSILRITHNGVEVDASLAVINEENGVVTFSPAETPDAVGEYLVSVRMTVGNQKTDYPDALKVVVKGLLFAQTFVAATRGEESAFPMEVAYLVQSEGTIFSLEIPADNSDYEHFTIDPSNGTITVDAAAEAGIYPLSVRAKNRTNPDGALFSNVLTVTVESKPYGLTYTPAEVTLIPMEGNTSPKPALRAATLEEGTAVKYSLLDDFGGTFSIDSATGVITLAEDSPLVSQTARSFALQVRVTNSKGSASFPGAYTVTVDPQKKAEPVSGIEYPDLFPVKLRPGEAWTSERPLVTGSTVGIEWALVDAPEGITIDRKTGIITLAEGHHMPMITTGENRLTVSVKNQGMAEPMLATLGDFSIDPILWTIQYITNTKNDSRTNSGVGNMDRYSFSAYIQNNQTEANKNNPTSIAVRHGWGKSNQRSWQGLECLDFMNGKSTNTWSDNINQNNDWMVSSEIELPESSFHPAICFNLGSRYGTDAQNIIELYVAVIDDTHPYVKGEQNQDDKGMDAQPGEVEWIKLASSKKTDDTFPAWIEGNVVTDLATKELLPRAFDLTPWKGKHIRFGLRQMNPTVSEDNTRTWRVESLRVEDSFTPAPATK